MEKILTVALTVPLAQLAQPAVIAAQDHLVIGPLKKVLHVEMIRVQAMGPFAQLARPAINAAQDHLAIGTGRTLMHVGPNRAGEAERRVLREHRATSAAMERAFFVAIEPNYRTLFLVDTTPGIKFISAFTTPCRSSYARLTFLLLLILGMTTQIV